MEKIRFSEKMEKIFEDAWNNQRKNYLDVVFEMDIPFGEKLIVLYMAHKRYSSTHIYLYSMCIIEALFLSKDNGFKDEEKMLFIMLFSKVDNKKFEIVIDRIALQNMTSMDKSQLKSATTSLIAKKIIIKEGDKYKIDISKYIWYFAMKYNLSV